MTSQLLNFYSDLDGMTVTYLNKDSVSTTPTVYSLSEIPASVETAHLPCRILLPVGQGQSGTPNAMIIRSPNVTAQWSITDLFLLETAARDAGLNIQAPVLMAYVVAYVDALSIKFNPVHTSYTNAYITSANITPGMYEYPQGSGTWFYGVKSDIVIEEIF